MNSLTFGLYRILGNDLPPRHHTDQTLKNLQYIAQSELPFPNVTKKFVVNRILNQHTESLICRYLDQCGFDWIHIPVQPHEYRELSTPIDKVKYLTNVNAARNACLEDGLGTYDVVLPLDGASFFTEVGWYTFEDLVYQFPDDAVFAIPTVRVDKLSKVADSDNMQEIREEYHFGEGRTIVGLRETSLAFTSKADVRFNEDLVYGQVDKVELMWRLGIPGPWDSWEPHIRAQALGNLSKHAGSVKIAGSVVRLPSYSEGDGTNLVRGSTRRYGLQLLVIRADSELTDRQ
jgi:hypothetical protein